MKGYGIFAKGLKCTFRGKQIVGDGIHTRLQLCEIAEKKAKTKSKPKAKKKKAK